MAEETKQTETKQTAPETTPDAGERRVPESALRAQAAEFAKREAELASKLKSFEEAQAKAKDEQLKADGKFQELAEAAEKKLKEAEAAFAAKERRLSLEIKLAGITNEWARKGAIAECPQDMKVDDYVAKLRTDAPDLFKAPGLPPGTPPQGGASGKAGNSAIEQLEARAKKGDASATAQLLKMMMAGEYTPA